jgi:demethylmenaquinone methyltransferase / 2-methoxy-6-polyprenyl-1,4-benzoquinol methylase
MRLATARTRAQGLLAVYEKMPFESGSFDSAMAGFSLRDAKDLLRALAEINHLLRLGGKFLIVDLSKPDSEIKSGMIAIYWRVLAPAIAFLSSGKLGLKFGGLATTYRKLPRISEFFALVKKSGFGVSKAEFSMLGGACVILLSKESEI